ncbi:hypothetical protein SAMN04487995_2278 [Dyadobacter koreensis]|uniref:Uncharacterized protein n=1 Tax=Dyadobacter koreensis TaxID=408657 RepID=A0A1H6TUX8_9BACT|nr:hypothetical protein SAMN04487995_2278 [Dyadobacter koreensis]
MPVFNIGLVKHKIVKLWFKVKLKLSIHKISYQTVFFFLRRIHLLGGKVLDFINVSLI